MSNNTPKSQRPDNHCTCDPDNFFMASCNNEPSEPHLCPYKEADCANDSEGEYCSCCPDCEEECHWSS